MPFRSLQQLLSKFFYFDLPKCWCYIIFLSSILLADVGKAFRALVSESVINITCLLQDVFFASNELNFSSN